MKSRLTFWVMVFALLISCGQGLRRGVGGAGGGGVGDEGDDGGSGGDGGSSGGNLGASLSVSPTTSTRMDLLTITGTGFASGATVTVGGVDCGFVTVVSSTQITCQAGPHSPGPVDVVVTQGAQSATLEDGFTYTAYLYLADEPNDRILRFRIEENGTLTSLGSPTSVGDAPFYLTIPSQSPFLMVGLRNALAIATLGISVNGSLDTTLADSPTIGFLATEFAMAAAGDILYQALMPPGGGGGPNFGSFSVSSTGAITQSQTSGTGDTSTITRVSPDGRSAYVAINASSDALLGFQLTGETISAQPGSPYLGNVDVVDMEITPDGKFLYLVDSISTTTTPYRRNATTGELTVGTQVSNPQTGVHITTHPSRRCLYSVVDIDDNGFVASWDATTGELTNIPSSNFSTEDAPAHLVFDPGGNFAYVSNSGAGSINVYSVGSDCKLTAVGTPVAGQTGAVSMASF